MKQLKLLCLFLASASGVARAQEPLPALIREIKPAVVTISAYDSAGASRGSASGFFIRNDLLVTNYHVLIGAYRADVRTAGGETYPILGVAAENRDRDLILLGVESSASKNMKQLEVIAALPEVGERIIVVGSPFGFEQTVSDGIVSSLRVEPAVDTVIQITAPFSPGSSGSPVVNLNGKVIGVASRQVTQAQNLNFAVPGKWVLALTPEMLRPLSEWARTAGNESEGVPDPTLEDLGKKGQVLLDAGKYQEALACFTQVAERNPNIPELWLNIGSCQAHLGNWEEAIVVSERALDLKPDLVMAHFNQGTAHGMLGRWKESEGAFAKALQFDANDVDALSGLARAQTHLGRPQEAIETCRKAIRIDPAAPGPHHGMAEALLKLGRNDDASVEAKKALERNPDFVDAYQTLGLALSHLDRHQEAADAFKEAVRRSPHFAEARCNLGLAYAHLERWAEAVVEYKETIRLRPDLVEAHYNLGLGYFRTGDKASALDEYKILQKLNKRLADQLFKIIYK